jgi:hypothetical protein
MTKSTIPELIILYLSVLSLAVSCVAKHIPADTIKFSHYIHEKQKVDCRNCHENVLSDAEKRQSAFPDMEICSDCHDIEDETNCGSCHSNTNNPDTYAKLRDTHLLFSHQLHQKRTSNCAECHASINTKQLLTSNERKLPGHTECSTCHTNQLKEGRCNMCHDRLDLFSRKPETIFSHDIDFIAKHGNQASANTELCAQCHDQSYCADCHNKNAQVRPSLKYPERVDRSFVHSGDWISRHSIESRVNDSSCTKCHGISYCNSCHEQNGKGALLGTSSPHPSASIWMSTGPSSHGYSARRNIMSCASCHEQGANSNCVKCHGTGGVNPHPSGWKTPVPMTKRSSHTMCSVCHPY